MKLLNGSSSSFWRKVANVLRTKGKNVVGLDSELRFYEGVNYVGFEAPALAADQIWVLPDADGTVDQTLKTDGAGNLSWGSAAVDKRTLSNYVGT